MGCCSEPDRLASDITVTSEVKEEGVPAAHPLLPIPSPELSLKKYKNAIDLTLLEKDCSRKKELDE